MNLCYLQLKQLIEFFNKIIITLNYLYHKDIFV